MLKAIGGLGPLELGLILGVVILIFGAGKLPKVGQALGEGIGNFKRARRGADEEAEPARLPQTVDAPHATAEKSATPAPDTV